jgi:spore cortex formation protein SpoVR/YcgB (stage V sporulation)
VVQQHKAAQTTITELRQQREAEREALKKLQEVNDKMQQAIDNLPSASRDDLLEFMRNGTAG